MYGLQETQRVEREFDNGAQYDAIRQALVDEFLQAATMPLMATVRTPTDLNTRRRAPFMEVFMDGLGWSKNEALQARVVAILRTHGKDVLEALADQHGAEYADVLEVQQ